MASWEDYSHDERGGFGTDWMMSGINGSGPAMNASGGSGSGSTMNLGGLGVLGLPLQSSTGSGGMPAFNMLANPIDPSGGISYFGNFDTTLVAPHEECEILGSELPSPEGDAQVGDSPGAAAAAQQRPGPELLLEPSCGMSDVTSCAIAPSMDVASLLAAPPVSLQQTPMQPLGAIHDPSPTTVCSPPAIKQEQTRCVHCLRRLKDMLESFSVQCQAGSRKWEQNWRESGSACFGACQSGEFCTDHGFPLPVCLARHEETRHCVFSYRGTWVMQRAKRDLAEVTPAQQLQQQQQQPQQQQSQAQPPRSRPKRHRPTLAELTSSSSSLSDSGMSKGTGCQGSPRECVVRLEKLRSYEWVCNDQRAVQRIREAELAAATLCQGYCRTQYCCKIHWCPAHIHKEEGKATRYRCPHPHESKGKKGRHHLDYAFYCPDPACCNGKWYSRDETHNRRHAPKTTEIQDRMFADAGVQGARPDIVAPLSLPDDCRAGRVGPLKGARRHSGEADSDSDYDYEAERRPLVSPCSPGLEQGIASSPYAAYQSMNTAAPDMVAVPVNIALPGPAISVQQMQRSPSPPGGRKGSVDSMGSIISGGSSIFRSINGSGSRAGGSTASGSGTGRFRGRVILPRAVFVGLVAMCGVLVLAAAVPSAILARSLLVGTPEATRAPLTRMCWSARWVGDTQKVVGTVDTIHIAERCEDCSWVENSGKYLCTAQAATDRKLSLLATIDPSRNVLTGYVVLYGPNGTDITDTEERTLPCIVTVTQSLTYPLVAGVPKKTGSDTVVPGTDSIDIVTGQSMPTTAVVVAAEDSWTFVLSRA